MPKNVAISTAKPLVKFAKLEIDGETYSLFCDFNDIAEAEPVAQCNLLLGLAGMLSKGMTARETRGLLYAALRRAHPKTTIEAAGNLVRPDTLPEIHDALLLAYNASLPESKKILKNPTKAAEDGASPEI